MIRYSGYQFLLSILCVSSSTKIRTVHYLHSFECRQIYLRFLYSCRGIHTCNISERTV